MSHLEKTVSNIVHPAAHISWRLATATLLVMSSMSAMAAPQMQVGVLLPGSKADGGWMESGYSGVTTAQKAFGPQLKTQLIENINYADMEQALTNLAIKNQLVIGIGGQTQAAILKVAKRFPQVKFSIVGGNQIPNMPSNVAGYDVKQAQIAFVAGAAAAMLTKTGKISYVGGMEIPSIVNAGKEFANGAHYINPKIEEMSTFTGDFDNVSKAHEATLAAISQGADIHYHILNLGLKGLEQAAKEKNTHIIGSYTDRCGTNPLYLAYTITGVGYQVQYAIEQLSKGTWQPGYKAFGLAMGPKASGMKICKSTPDMDKKITQIEQDILSGKIKVSEG
ncbi:BMP family protein [Aquirhabdus parva]|uniref:BMP family ABC transporter substrate-binding protein n=1 Tax=Aquirhabdus parva TaxID=2283318 RepID=A0A345PB26_9GAMM|nr:BMP family protein [Aquirhabdus parva]AXI04485.1 BMP family ABC transporter substrate-binding protein [Aquirhabdus parva]